MKKFIAILIGKIIRLICRILKKGGTASPGRIALKICPDLLSCLGKDVKCIIITGTNGKTTSCRMVEEGVKRAGFSYFANRSGANLIEGIATDFIVNSTLSGKCRKEYAVLETDEFASKEVCRYLQPEIIYVTNIFVDQVDRFGGVKNTRDGIATGIKNAPGATVVLNADDSVSASLGKDIPNKVVYYGIEESAVKGMKSGGSSDVNDCIICGSDIEFSFRTFSHLGGFKCSKCGYSRPVPSLSVSKIISSDMSGTIDMFRLDGEEFAVSVNLPAMYNIYNALGSFLSLHELGIDNDTIILSLANFRCGFGRMETLNIGASGGKMVLVKNGAGCDQVLEYLLGIKDAFVLSIYLNNNVSDGVDISWLETANFELLNECNVEKIYVSGLRIEEMYERLVKAGLGKKLIKEPSCKALISSLNKETSPVIIMPTYTGMMETRAEIIKQCGGTEFWQG